MRQTSPASLLAGILKVLRPHVGQQVPVQPLAKRADLNSEGFMIQGITSVLYSIKMRKRTAAG
jgi:hypothetical protein